MSFEDERERRRKADRPADGDVAGQSGSKRKKRAPSPEIGLALRSAYDRTVSEPIPPEMLDLLGKLG